MSRNHPQIEFRSHEKDWIDFDIYFPFPIVEFVIKTSPTWADHRDFNSPELRQFLFQFDRMKMKIESQGIIISIWIGYKEILMCGNQSSLEKETVKMFHVLVQFFSFWPAFPRELSSPAIQENKKIIKMKYKSAGLQQLKINGSSTIESIHISRTNGNWMSFTKETLGIIYGHRADISIYIFSPSIGSRAGKRWKKKDRSIGSILWRSSTRRSTGTPKSIRRWHVL